MTRNVSQEAAADYCRFCGTADAQCFGKARTYLRWPTDVGLDDSVYQFSICAGCTLTERSNTEVAAFQFRSADRDYLETCDVCGFVGCSSESRRVADDTYRLRNILGWSVEIAGFDGSTSACTECSPAEPIDCVRQHGRTYDDAAPRLVEPPFDDGDSKSPNSARTENVQVGFEEWAE